MKKRIPILMIGCFALASSAFAGDLIVDGTGRVGIRTTTPAAALHVRDGIIRVDGEGQLGLTSFMYSDVLWNSPTISGLKYGGTRTAPTATQNNTQLLRLTAGGYDGTQSKYDKAMIYFKASENWTTSGQGSKIEFRTTPNGTTTTPTQMILTGQGNLGIGNTNPTEKLFVSGNIYATGTITQGSSRELKEDIASLSTEEALNAFQMLEPVKYRYKADSKKDLQIGFIAEDVPEIVASADRKSLNSMDIVAVLTKVVQEQNKIIKDLSERLDSVEKRIGRDSK